MSLRAVCSHCNSAIKATDKFAGKRAKCPKCGNEVSFPTAEAVQADGRSAVVDRLPPPLPEGPLSFRCPACDSEQTQRVSVIVTGGTTNSTAQVGSTGIIIGDGLNIMPVFSRGKTRGRQQTELAEGLAPPEPPKAPAPLRNDCKILAVVWMVIAFLLVIVFGPGAGITYSPRNATLDEMNGRSGLIMLVSLLVLIPGAYFLARWQIPPPGQAQRDAHAAAVDAHRDAIKAHAEAVKEWSNSFFCHRCGKVFNPAGHPEV